MYNTPHAPKICSRIILARFGPGTVSQRLQRTQRLRDLQRAKHTISHHRVNPPTSRPTVEAGPTRSAGLSSFDHVLRRGSLNSSRQCPVVWAPNGEKREDRLRLRHEERKCLTSAEDAFNFGCKASGTEKRGANDSNASCQGATEGNLRNARNIRSIYAGGDRSPGCTQPVAAGGLKETSHPPVIIQRTLGFKANESREEGSGDASSRSWRVPRENDPRGNIRTYEPDESSTLQSTVRGTLNAFTSVHFSENGTSVNSGSRPEMGLQLSSITVCATDPIEKLPRRAIELIHCQARKVSIKQMTTL